MNFDDIVIFREVALIGSMTQAAEKLGYAQSSVTAKIRGLENKFNTKLFYRTAKGVHLTQAGKILFDNSLKLIRTIEDLQVMLNSNYTKSSMLRLGAMETTAAIRLPAVLKEFNALDNKTEIFLQTGTTEELCQQVLAYEIDLAFVAAPINHPELKEFKVFEEELVLVSAKADADKTLSEILKKRAIIVFRMGCSYRLLLERYLSEQKMIPLKRFEFGSLEAIIGAVDAGLGISLLPRSVVEKRLNDSNIVIFDLPEHIKRCDTSLIMRKDILQTLEMRDFLLLLKK